MKIYFVTINDNKILESAQYLKQFDLDLYPVKYQIQEISHVDLHEIVKHKALRAYEQFHLPCVVEHGGLFIDALNGLPGGFSCEVWEKVGDRLCTFLDPGDVRHATAKSMIGFCDGRKVRFYSGETRGVITERGCGQFGYKWDPIFIPDGSTQTYAEMGAEKKHEYSQFNRAWSELVKDLGPGTGQRGR